MKNVPASKLPIPNVPFAVLASGLGTNFEALLKAGYKDRIVALVTDKPQSGAAEKAKAAGVRLLVIEPGTAPDTRSLEVVRREHDERILAALLPLGPRFLVMAGYMRIVTSRLIEAFRSDRGYSRVVNVHPSLLPAFPGVRAYRQAFKHGVKVAGVTVHLVEEGVDQGPICAQEAFSIADCADTDEVERRGLAVEHRLYPETLRWVLAEKFETDRSEGRLRVRPH